MIKIPVIPELYISSEQYTCLSMFCHQLGGFTSTVGDPSGRSGSRSDLPSQTAAENTACITTSVKNIFGNHDRIFWKNKDESQLKRPM